MDDILEAYSKRTLFDDAIEVLEILTHGFNPCFWEPRGYVKRQQEQNRILREIVSVEMMKGEAFGL